MKALPFETTNCLPFSLIAILRLSFTGQDNNVMKKYEFYLPVETNLYRSFWLVYYPFQVKGIVIAAAKNPSDLWTILFINTHNKSIEWVPRNFGDPEAEKRMKRYQDTPIFEEVALTEKEKRESFHTLFESNFEWRALK
jgi:hypothetical protein